MPNVRVGQQVINKMKERGTIVAVEDGRIVVAFANRTAKFKDTAFADGFLQYADADLQNQVEAAVAQAQQEQAQQALAKKQAEETAQNNRRFIQTKASRDHFKVAVVSADIRLDAAPITFTSVRKGDQEPIQAVFAACDKETAALFAQFDPQMEYYRRGNLSYSKSKCCVGFLTQYLGTYVLRVFSRNDTYKNGTTDGLTIMHSDTTEVMRILRVNGRDYNFTKNVSLAGGGFSHSQHFNNWHVSEVKRTVLLSKVIRCCDGGYLGDYVAADNVECVPYARLLFAAFTNPKMEVVFKNRAFGSAARLENLAEYLEEFSSRHIDHASKFDALSTLPVLKHCGLIEPPILFALEQVMRKQRDGRSVYDVLKNHLTRLGLYGADMDTRLVAFLKKVDPINVGVYLDYINELYGQPNVTLRDFFDKDYFERHLIMLREKRVRVSEETQRQYGKVAEELSWIDREEEGYFLVLPKTIAEFVYEGEAQHNCVFTNRYYNKVIQRYSIIVFLRRDKTQPFVTIEYEYETFEVLQALGKYNRCIDRHLYHYVVELGKRLRHEMLSQQ